MDRQGRMMDVGLHNRRGIGPFYTNSLLHTHTFCILSTTLVVVRVEQQEPPTPRSVHQCCGVSLLRCLPDACRDFSLHNHEKELQVRKVALPLISGRYDKPPPYHINNAHGPFTPSNSAPKFKKKKKKLHDKTSKPYLQSTDPLDKHLQWPL